MRHTSLLLPVSLVFFAAACSDKGDDGTPTDGTTFEGNQAPTVSITSHLEGDTEREGYPFTISGQAADTDHDNADLTVAIFAGDEALCEGIAIDDDGSYACDADLSPGNVELRAVVTDADGATGSAAVQITIAATDAPEARLDAPAPGNDPFYADVVVDVAGFAADAETGPDALDITLSSDIDPDVDFGLTIDGDGNLAGSAILSEGIHTLTLTVTDETGKTGQDSVTIEVGPNNTAPLCAITGPVDGGVSESGDTVEFAAEVSDPDVGPDSITVTWDSDVDGPLADGTAADTTTFAATLSDGSHTITLVAQDEVGAICSTTITHIVGVAPTVAISSPLDGGFINEGDTIELVADFTDTDGDVSAATVTWTDDLGNTLAVVNPATDGTMTPAEVNNLAPGARTITAMIEDADGLTASQSISILVNGKPSAPGISLASATPGTEDDLVASIDVDSVDPEGSAVTYRYTWFKDGVEVTDQTAATVPASATSRGESWSVAVVANDGAVDGDATVANAVIANTTPIADSVVIDSDSATASDDLSCVATGIDADGDPVAFTYAWSVDGVSAGTGDILAAGAFAKGNSVVCTATPDDGFTTGAAVASSAVIIRNTAPEVDSGALTPNPATAVDALTCSGVASDLDGDSTTLSYAWWVNSADTGVSGSSLDPAYFSRGDEIFCRITANDGTDDSAFFDTAPVTITNTVPVVDSVAINPDPATTSDDLTCLATGSDDDGDALTFSYTWTVNGIGAGSGETLSSTAFSKGDVIGCEATANDTFDTSAGVTAPTITIGNSAPAIDSVEVTPSVARAGEPLACSVTSSDPDGDSLTTSYSWTVNGIDAGITSATFAGSVVRDDQIICTAEVSDGTDSSGATASAPLTISNTEPTISSISLSTTSPTASDDITCNVTGSDADGDTVTYTYEWLVNGVDMGIIASTLPAGAFSKGDSIACRATPSDGTVDGAWAQTGFATAIDSPPELSSVSISPATPNTQDDLTCVASASDADGDAITYTYAWTQNGVAAGTSATIPAAATTKGDVFACTATPIADGVSGASDTSSTATIANSTPSITSLAMSPSTPFTDSTITATAAATDGDGDAVSLTYEFAVNGATVQSGASNTLASSFFTRDDTVLVTVTPNDGTESGATDSAGVTIANSPPTAPVVVIDPEAPGESDDLICDIDTPSTDADGDVISYLIDWEVDGVEYTGVTTTSFEGDDTVPSSETAAGEEWTCYVSAVDGFDTGPEGSASDTVLSNQAVFDITAAELVIDGFTCTGGDLTLFGDPGDQWGADWSDTDSRTPASVTIEFEYGFAFGGGGARDVYLNGVLVDTITVPAGGSCPSSSIGSITVNDPALVTNYIVGGANSLRIDSDPAAPEGPIQMGSGNYITVTVDY